ncbi:hypothetical protein [Brevundimonas naejangsanensis]|uniref:hypothetical protein n=1 Tax=Brevundimonas naejangsanensis TaxID=588932 RepID=UPI0003FD6856|nr:hypothetical protein [Brevundimonas naejangsanensis]
MADLRDFPALLTRDNRAKGLMQELAEAIDAEDSSLNLWRLEAALRSASQYARGRRCEVEKQTRELERARHARPRRLASVGKPIKRRWLT